MNTVQDDQRGFTLVELLVSIAVIGIAAVGIAGLFYTVQYTQRSARYQETATRAAQRQIELLRNSGYNGLASGETVTFTDTLPSSLPGSRSGTAVISEPSPGLKRVDVTVSYTDNGRTKSANLSSYIGVIGIAQ